MSGEGPWKAYEGSAFPSAAPLKDKKTLWKRIKSAVGGAGKDDLNFLKGLAAGIDAAPVGVAQLAGKGIQAVTGNKAVANFADALNRSRLGLEHGEAGRAGSFIGDTFNPLYFAAPEVALASKALEGVKGLGTAAKAADAAIAGAATSAAQPVQGGRFWPTKEAQATGGAILGAPFGVAGHLLSKLPGSEAALMAKRGIPVATTDIVPGKVSGIAEQLAAISPARFANAWQQQRAMEAVQKPMIYDWVLQPLDETLEPKFKPGQEALGAVQDRVDAAYDRAKTTGPVTLPSVGVLSSRWLARQDGTQLGGAIEAFGGEGNFDALNGKAQDEVLRVIQHGLVRPLKLAENQEGHVSAKAFVQARSELRRQARALDSSPDGQLHEAGQFIHDFTDRMTETLAGDNPQLVNDLRRADKAYRRLHIFESAIPAKAGKKEADRYIVTPRQMLDAMTPKATKPGYRKILSGRNDEFQHFEKFRKVMAEPRNTNMLGWEMGMGTLGMLGAGIGGHESIGVLPALGLMGASVLPFTKAGSAATRALAFSPRTAQIARQIARSSGALIGSAEGGSP